MMKITLLGMAAAMFSMLAIATPAGSAAHLAARDPKQLVKMVDGTYPPICVPLCVGGSHEGYECDSTSDCPGGTCEDEGSC